MTVLELIAALQVYAARFGDSVVFVGVDAVIGVVENITVEPNVDDEGPAVVIWTD
jgi:hypothetical protein